MKNIKCLPANRCMLWHRWELIEDTGKTRYHQCKDCDARKAGQYGYGHQPINERWVLGITDLSPDQSLDHPVDELLRRAVTYAKNHSHSAKPRWSVVGMIFNTGSTTSADLCHQYGANPYQILAGSPQYCPECLEYTMDEEGTCENCS